MSKIPNIIHFVYGLAPNFGWDAYERMDRQRNIMVKSPKADAFDILKYLAVKSAHDVNKPDKIYFWYQHEPHGEWWDKAKPYLTLMKVFKNDLRLELFCLDGVDSKIFWVTSYKL